MFIILFFFCIVRCVHLLLTHHEWNADSSTSRDTGDSILAEGRKVCTNVIWFYIFNRYDMPWECWLQVDCYVYKMIYQIPSKKCISDTYTISIVTLYAIEDPRYANTSIPCLLYCCIIWGALTVSVEVLVDCCIQCIPIYMLLILLIFLCRVHSVAPYQTAKYRRHYPR